MPRDGAALIGPARTARWTATGSSPWRSPSSSCSSGSSCSWPAAAAPERLPPGGRGGRPGLRDGAAAGAGVRRRGAAGGLRLGLRALASRHAGRRRTGALGAGVRRASTSSTTGGTAPATGERALGGARRSPPERGLQPGGGAPAGRRHQLHLPAVLPSDGAPRRAARRLRDRAGALDPLPVLDPHRAGRKARAAGVGPQHALAPPRAPRHQPALPRQQLRRRPSSSGTASSAPSRRSASPASTAP